MKIIVIGDIHGSNLWENILDLENNTFDKVIFIGDYFDSFTINHSQQIENLKKIIEFKKKYNDKVELLIGNHDYQYLQFDDRIRCGGYNSIFHNEIYELLSKNIELFKFIYIEDKYLFSHAGLSNEYLNTLNDEFGIVVLYQINELLYTNRLKYLWKNSLEPSGDDIHESFLWIRPKSLSKNYVNKFIHIFGHTPNLDNPIVLEGSLYCVDLLHQKIHRYLTIENDKFIYKKIS